MHVHRLERITSSLADMSVPPSLVLSLYIGFSVMNATSIIQKKIGHIKLRERYRGWRAGLGMFRRMLLFRQRTIQTLLVFVCCEPICWIILILGFLHNRHGRPRQNEVAKLSCLNNIGNNCICTFVAGQNVLQTTIGENGSVLFSSLSRVVCIMS